MVCIGESDITVTTEECIGGSGDDPRRCNFEVVGRVTNLKDHKIMIEIDEAPINLNNLKVSSICLSTPMTTCIGRLKCKKFCLFPCI